MRRAAASVALASLKRSLTFTLYPVAADISVREAEAQRSPGRVRMIPTSKARRQRLPAGRFAQVVGRKGENLERRRRGKAAETLQEGR